MSYSQNYSGRDGIVGFSKVLLWNPCRFGLPEVLTRVHTSDVLGKNWSFCQGLSEASLPLN